MYKNISGRYKWNVSLISPRRVSMAVKKLRKLRPPSANHLRAAYIVFVDGFSSNKTLSFVNESNNTCSLSLLLIKFGKCAIMDRIRS